MRILILVRSLGIGGAERQISVLARGLVASGDEVTLATYYDGDTTFDLEGVRRISFGKRGRYDVYPLWRQLDRELRAGRYDLVYAFMPTANILAALAARGTMPVVFGVRATRDGQEVYGHLNRLLLRLERHLAERVALTISNSEAARRELVRLGVAPDRVAVVPNGIDTDHFRPDSSAGARLRRAWNIEPDALLVGRIARIDAMKDIDTALSAFAKLRSRVQMARLVVVGNGESSEISRLRAVAERHGIAEAVTFRPAEADPAPLYAALDLLVSSSSFGEGFPNVVAEAMAAGVPAVTTDVGDSALIVSGLGEAVPPRRPDLLGDALVRAADRLHRDGDALRRAVRERVVGHYSEALLVERTRSLLQMTVEAHRNG